MRFHIEQRFHAAVSDVQDAMCDRAFYELLGELPGLGRPTLVAQERTAAGIHQQVRYHFAGDLSSAVRHVIDPAKLSWIEDSTIDVGAAHTRWSIHPDHYPDRLACSGTYQLVADGQDACMRIAEGTLRVRAALVASRVEAAIVSGLQEHADAEVDLVDRFVAGLSA